MVIIMMLILTMHKLLFYLGEKQIKKAASSIEETRVFSLYVPQEKDAHCPSCDSGMEGSTFSRTHKFYV